MPLLEGRRALIFGVANRRSIAWAIAQALAREGAQVAFTFQGERIEQGVRDLAATVNSPLVVPADVTSNTDLDRVFDAVDKTWAGLDILVHSVAFAPPQTFEQPFAATRRYGETSPRTTLATQRCTCAVRWQPTSRARSCWSTRATASSGCRCPPS